MVEKVVVALYPMEASVESPRRALKYGRSTVSNAAA